MGTYTTPYKFFKPSSSEIVDVETNLNMNLDILDQKMKGVFNYQDTDVAVLSSAANIDRSNKFKYYKSHSNSVPFFVEGNITQDQHLKVWENNALNLTNGWNNAANSLSIPAFQIDWENVTARKIRLIGTIRLNNYDAIVPGTGYNVALIDAAYRPATDKSYMCNANQNNNIAKVTVFAATGVVQVIRYGPVQTAGAASNVITFDYMEWAL